MQKKFSFVAPALTTICMLLLGSGMGAKAATVIKIATQSPLSGSMSVIGSDIKSGTQLAIEQLSGPLTKMGFKIQLAPYDDQGNPDTGVANAKAIVSDPEILGVIGHYNSGVQIPSSEEYHAANLANISPANTNPRVTDRGYLEVSRVCGRDDVQGAVGAQYAKKRGIKNVFVMHDKTAYGQGIAEYFQKEARTLGVKVAGFTGTEEKANFDAILSPVLASKPDCIYFGGMFDQAAVLFKQARQKGFKGMCLSDDGFDSPDSTKIGGDALLQGAGTFFSTVSGPASIYPGTKKFVADFKAKFGNDPQPFAAQSYDATAMLLKGIEMAAKANGGKVPEREAVAKAVRALQQFKGITGTITFDRKGDPMMARYFVVQDTAKDPAQWANNKVIETLDIKAPQ
jgi:branched-chain amino acid transport system substrate-binding protein